jgi:HepT-like protein
MTADRGPRFVRLAAMLRQQRESTLRVVAEAREALEDFADREPPLRELRGIGAILHDFYTGIEHLFERIAPELNGGVPAGPSWHRELLENMTLELPGVRPPLLRAETAHALDEFLRFRHLFRNLYGFELLWPKVRALLEQLSPTWEEVDADLDRFLAFLEAAAEEDS